MLLISGYFFYTLILRKPLYISPLPSNNNSVLASQSDKNLTVLDRQLRDKRIEFSKIEEVGTSYIIYLKNGSQIILSTHKDIKSQIASLQFLLPRLTMEGKLFSRLDLRFDKPVIIIRE